MAPTENPSKPRLSPFGINIGHTCNGGLSPSTPAPDFASGLAVRNVNWLARGQPWADWTASKSNHSAAVQTKKNPASRKALSGAFGRTFMPQSGDERSGLRCQAGGLWLG